MPRKLVQHISGFACEGISRDDWPVGYQTKGASYLEYGQHHPISQDGTKVENRSLLLYALFQALSASWSPPQGEQFSIVPPFCHNVLLHCRPEGMSEYGLRSMKPRAKIKHSIIKRLFLGILSRMAMEVYLTQKLSNKTSATCEWRCNEHGQHMFL